MKNEYLHETLMRMYPEADPNTSWELYYDPLIEDTIIIRSWNLPVSQPTQEEIDILHAIIVTEKEQEENKLLEETIRTERDRRFRLIYDPSISQLFRKKRLATDSDELAAIEAQITKWDAYAKQLENIPQQPGFPWGGDIDFAPWPIPPEKPIE